MRVSAQPVVISLALVAMLQTLPQRADACSCLPTDVAASYNQSTDVFVARVVYGPIEVGFDSWYVARVRTPFKGCVQPKSWVLLRTGSNGASCGVSLSVGHTYLLNAYEQEGFGKTPVFGVSSCGINKKVSQLSQKERAFLMGRSVCCGDECECVDGSAPVDCFADPCTVSSCPTGTCQANYCGGCNAEYFDQYGMQVCVGCESGKDCAFNQVCSADGLCTAECYSDKDCNAGYWCRDVWQSDQKECVPYAQEGESCGGFTPIEFVTKCAPDLVCTDTPPFLADAPGKCKQPCKADTDCAGGQYCSNTGHCRDDGSCWDTSDCSLDGNLWPHAKCLGYALCSDKKACEWFCGDPDCPNLAKVDFGFCDMVMGWGNVDGKCATISGCGETQGFELYASKAACESACGKTPAP